MRSTIAAPVEFAQYGSDEWQRFFRAHGLTPSMSRRDNCWDNAVSTPDFFRSRLDVTVDPRHLLVVLALLLDWEQIEAWIALLFASGDQCRQVDDADVFGSVNATVGIHPGRPRLSFHLTVSLQ